MMKQSLRVPKTSLRLFAVLLALCTISAQVATIAARRITRLAPHDEKEDNVRTTLLSKFPDVTLHRRRKRQTAEISIQDSSSRRQAADNRRLLLMKLLNNLDSSVEGSCNCLSTRTASANCNCEIANLFSSMMQFISGSGSVDKSELRNSINRLDPTNKHVFHRFLAGELRRARRRAKLHSMRRAKHVMRAILRRKTIRSNPRAAFDGKHLFMF